MTNAPMADMFIEPRQVLMAVDLYTDVLNSQTADRAMANEPWISQL